MSLRRQVALGAGGFRTEVGRVGPLPSGAEETELAIRLRRLLPWSQVVYVPTSRVRHHAPASRAQWSYFRSRCFHEGRSKAILSRLEGSSAGLSSERSYTFRVLPAGIFRGMSQLVHGDRGGAQRAAAIVAGLMITTFGYVSGLVEHRNWPRRNWRLAGDDAVEARRLPGSGTRPSWSDLERPLLYCSGRCAAMPLATRRTTEPTC